MSELEETLAGQLRLRGVEGFEREHRFHETRRWRFDFAFPDQMLAAECEGGLFSGGRHVRGAAYEKDLAKYNAAAMMGWTVVRFGPNAIKTGEAADRIVEFLRAASAGRGERDD